MSSHESGDNRSISVDGSAIGSAISSGDHNTITISNTIQITADKIKSDALIITSPYKGLKTFEPKDSERFYGREQFLASLVNELEQTNFVLLLGASGSGKSSVVKAGLIPYLQDQRGNSFEEVVFNPDADPFESLYRSLPRRVSQAEAEVARVAAVDTLNQVVSKLKPADSFWLIFIDQFEELFTVCEAAKRNDFIRGLVALCQQHADDPSLKIVATMRADFLDQLDAYPANQLANRTQKHRPLITQMQPDEMRLAIEQPAAHHGVVFEAGLVEEIIHDVQGRAGYLPLLQYALNLLWETEAQTNQLHDRTLKAHTYRCLGGVRGALQQRVDQLYQGLSPEDQAIAQRIFLKLVQIGADEATETDWRPVRRRASICEFASEAETRVLKILIDAHLLVSGEVDTTLETDHAIIQRSTVEIAHEVLLTSWTQLNDWIKQNREAIALRHRLNEDVKHWQITRSDEELWSGLKLEKVVKLRGDADFNEALGGFHAEANEFIDASVDLDNRKQLEQNQRALKIRMAAGDQRRSELLDLLEICTVKLSRPGVTGSATGFFVAPGKILTCASAMLEDLNQPIKADWLGHKDLLEATIEPSVADGLGLLKLTSEVEHPCVYLDPTFRANDLLCTYGYTHKYYRGAYTVGKGQKPSRQNRQTIEFETNSNALALESSPLLNWQTLKVCGIVQSTHNHQASRTLDPSDDVNIGKAISASTIFSAVSGLKKAQNVFHKSDRRWWNLLPARCKPRTVLLTSFGMAALVILLRSFQFLQPFELGFYDFLMRSRLNPPQPSDRFLIVNIQLSDVEAQRARGETVDVSLSDVTLVRLLEKINTLEPLAVGLDIYREQALTAQLPSQGGSESAAQSLPATQSAIALPPAQLTKQTLQGLLQQPNLFVVCKAGDAETPGIAAPPGVALQQIGFSDFALDNDRILRRQLLAFQPENGERSRCPASESFNLILAKYYLEKVEKVTTQVDFSQACNIQFDHRKGVTNLRANTGGYQGYAGEQLNKFEGCQTLLKFRQPQPNQGYQIVTLETFLQSDYTAQDFKDRIILIGIDRNDGVGDNWKTPYDRGQDQVTTGSVIQAQMIDQIIDVATEKDAFIWVLPSQVDLLLIVAAALVGGIIGWWVRSPYPLILIIGLSGGSVLILSFAVFQLSGWLPLMPHFLALSASSVYIYGCNQRLNSKHKHVEFIKPSV